MSPCRPDLVIFDFDGVLIDSEDGQGRRWSTVGVSANIVDASFQALQDAVLWKLVRDGAPVLQARGPGVVLAG